MKKLLSVIGIIAIIAAVLALLFAALNWYSFYNVMDGSAALYDRLQRRMVVSFAIGFVLAVIGVVCRILSGKQ